MTRSVVAEPVPRMAHFLKAVANANCNTYHLDFLSATPSPPDKLKLQ